MCFHVREMRHSPQWCFPYTFYRGDDDYTPYEAHAQTPLPNAPDKYSTMHRALRDACNSPFELPDGRFITFCGPHINDYKCTCHMSGMDITPKSDQNDIFSKARNADRGKPPGPLSFMNLI